jgi:hypothetical protein
MFHLIPGIAFHNSILSWIGISDENIHNREEKRFSDSVVVREETISS